MAAIAGIATLEKLSAQAIGATDKGLAALKPLAKLPKLRTVWASKTCITEAGAKKLADAVKGCRVSR